MKKRIFFLILCCFTLKLCSAQTLNFRTNTLTFYPVEIENEQQLFTIYANNWNDEILYSLNPFSPPNYQDDYQSRTDILKNLPLETQNRIKAYVELTKNAEDFATQLYYYINTQMLIWKTYHPDFKIKILRYQEEIKAYENKMNESYQKRIPTWIQDYEIDSELILPATDYEIISNDCEIISDSEKVHIRNCSQNTQIKIRETKGRETLNGYETAASQILESQNTNLEWSINITLKHSISSPSNEEEKEEAPKPEPTPKPEEIPSSKEEISIPVKPSETENTKIEINHVPNTKEEGNVLWDLIALWLKWLSQLFSLFS